MKRVIRYMLDGDGTVPKFVQDGGYFPSGGELIGVSVNETQLFVPKTVARLTRAQLLEWVKSTQVNMKGEKLPTKEFEAIVSRFLLDRGMKDYE